MNKKESTEQTKKHIIEVARTEFFKKGYAAASINTIVDAASVTKPTIYYHFKSKEGLFLALVKEAYHDCYEHRRAAVDERASASEQIKQVIAADFAFCLQQPELMQFVLSLSFSLPEEQGIDLRPIHQRDYEFYKSLITRGIESGEFACEDVTAAALALQGMIAINVMSYLKMGHAPDFLSEKHAANVAEVLLNGIKK